MFKFIHAADIHLDSPLLNLDQYEGAPTESLRVATREAFDRLIQLSIDEQVAFLLIAGDLYDQDSPDFNTPRHVREKFRELESHGIRVFIIQGNHDAASKTKRSFGALTFPENVHVFPTNKPATEYLEDLDVAIHGQGFANRSVEKDLSADYPVARSGAFNIGLLHTNVGGNSSHDNYAPSTLDGLRAKEYEYWALGHIHKRQEFPGGPQQQIRYSGNTQGRHIGECGPRGCLLVSVTDDRQISVKFAQTDVWRWAECSVDVKGAEDPQDVIDSIRKAIETELKNSDDRSLAVRVIVQGATTVDRDLRNYHDRWREELQRTIVDVFDDQVWLEKFKIRTTHPVTHSVENRSEAVGELVSSVMDVFPDGGVFESIRDDIERVLKNVPRDPRLEDVILDLGDDEVVRGLVEDARQLLVARLLDTSDATERGVA